MRVNEGSAPLNPNSWHAVSSSACRLSSSSPQTRLQLEPIPSLTLPLSPNPNLPGTLLPPGLARPLLPLPKLVPTELKRVLCFTRLSQRLTLLCSPLPLLPLPLLLTLPPLRPLPSLLNRRGHLPSQARQRA
ncbi:unnamed protein product [Closterium sp. NIES-54]